MAGPGNQERADALERAALATARHLAGGRSHRRCGAHPRRRGTWYRARLAELREELDEATSWNDPERARISVTRAIRAAVARIGEQSPALGGYLDAKIRTGTFCSYVPDPRAPITWEPERAP